MNRQRNALLRMATGLVLAGLCTGKAVGGDREGVLSVTLTNLPPGLILRDLGGQYVKLNDLCYPDDEKLRCPRRVVVLNFMSSSCDPCRKELPDLLAFLREAGTNRVAGFLVSLDPLSKSEQLGQFLQVMGVDCGVLLDPYKLAARKLGVMDKDGGGSIPRTFVFAPDGRLVGEINGKPEDLKGWLKAAVERAKSVGIPESKSIP